MVQKYKTHIHSFLSGHILRTRYDIVTVCANTAQDNMNVTGITRRHIVNTVKTKNILIAVTQKLE